MDKKVIYYMLTAINTAYRSASRPWVIKCITCILFILIKEVFPMKYGERVLEELKKNHASEPEFIQAATEVLETIQPALDAQPEFEAAGCLLYTSWSSTPTLT